MIYLASTSPRRKRLLKEAGISFKVLAPHYKEKHSFSEAPGMLVRRHALEKAMSVASRVAQGVVVGADTVVYFDKKVIGKPKSLKDAFKILTALQGRRHTVYTGVALLDIRGGKIKRKFIFDEKTQVYLKKMGPEAVRHYFRKVDPLDKAGAYAIQSRSSSIIKKVRGPLSNAVGLPVEKLCVKLTRLRSRDDTRRKGDGQGFAEPRRLR